MSFQLQKKFENNFKNLGIDSVPDHPTDELLIKAVEAELGDSAYAYFTMDGLIGVHHGLMLPFERVLSEKSFRRKDGSRIMLATPTLAQGINLPAELVIIAGDERYDITSGKMERLPAHELLNAAGRAGRAGYLAQGVVVVVPGEVATVDEQTITQRWWDLKNEVFSQSDQCLTIMDPLEYLIDSIHMGYSETNESQKYLLNRLKFKDEENGEHIQAYLEKSFVGYQRRSTDKWSDFQERIESVIKVREEEVDSEGIDDWAEKIAGNFGLDSYLVSELAASIEEIGLDMVFEFDIVKWVEWLCCWLAMDQKRILGLFGKVYSYKNLCRACGVHPETGTIEEVVNKFHKIEGLGKMWIGGSNLYDIEQAMTDSPDGKLKNARIFALRFVPDFSFAFGLASRLVREISDREGSSIPVEIQVLATCIREGYDEVGKLAIKHNDRSMSRVQVHQHATQAGIKLDSSDKSSFNDFLEQFK